MSFFMSFLLVIKYRLCKKGKHIMCQSKSLGGKRCAIHHHGTQAAIQSTAVKTNIDVEDVKDTFTFLNKEGKKLPEPSRNEYESYLEKERFMTEIDQTIDTRDKKMILKKLDKAKEENTPSGGTFHAWKNLMATTIQKFGRKTRLVLAGITVASVAFGIAGCAPTSSTPSSPYGSFDTATSISIIDGSQVTDSLGTYAKASVDPNSPIMKYDKTAPYVDAGSFAQLGLTDADAESAQQTAVTFVMTQMFDNAAADIPGDSANVLAAVGNEYVRGYYANKILDPANSTLLYTQKDGITFVRDGKSRISSNYTALNSLSAGSGGSGTSVTVSGISKVDYRINPTGSGAGYKTAVVDAQWSLRLQKDESGAWKINGYEDTFTTSLVK